MNAQLIESSDAVDYNGNFLLGIYCLWSSRYTQARKYFLSAVYETPKAEKQYSIYLSYVGLSAVLMDNSNGIIRHCYNSSDKSISIEPEIQVNLACAELIKGNRKNAIHAIDKFDGFIPTTGFKEIQSLYKIVGKRQKSINCLPKRESLLHKVTGKILRKRKSGVAKSIEDFIKKKTKNRYKEVMYTYK